MTCASTAERHDTTRTKKKACGNLGIRFRNSKNEDSEATDVENALLREVESAALF